MDRLRTTAFMLLLTVSAAATAAPVPATRDAGGRARVLSSLSLLNDTGLDFGELIVAGAGTAVIEG